MANTTIDSATKVNIGILVTLLGAIGAGGAYFGSLRSDIGQLQQSIANVEQAIQKASAQAQVDGRDLASVRTQLGANAALIQQLDVRLRRIEDRGR